MSIQISGFWRRQIVVIILLAAVLTSVALFVTRPLLANINETKKVLSIKNNELVDLQDKTIKLQKIARTANPDETYNKISHLLPDNPEVSNFIIQLENFSSERQTLIKNLSIAETKNLKKENGKSVSNTQFSFDLDASYPTMMQLISDLEGFERFNSIETINMLSRDDQTITIKVTGRIFYGK